MDLVKFLNFGTAGILGSILPPGGGEGADLYLALDASSTHFLAVVTTKMSSDIVRFLLGDSRWRDKITLY